MTPTEYRALTKKGKRSKYRAQACVVDGIRFHSKGEAKRWAELKLLHKAGEIAYLERQVRLPLKVDGRLIGEFVADFTYVRRGDTYTTIEDFKGHMTELARWKLRHVEAQFHRKVLLTGTASRRRKGS